MDAQRHPSKQAKIWLGTDRALMYNRTVLPTKMKMPKMTVGFYTVAIQYRQAIDWGKKNSQRPRGTAQ
jgi:hypothetical protein